MWIPILASRYEFTAPENRPEAAKLAHGRILVDKVGVGGGVMDRLSENG